MFYQSTANRQHAPHHAFTLVEVLATVTIMSIAGVVVVPHMLRTGQMGIQAAARIVIADIVYAQNQAIAQQGTHRLVFDTANDSYRLADSTGTTLTVAWKGASTQNYLIDFANDSRFAGVHLSSVDFASISTLEFDALGTPTNGGTIDLVADGFSYRITVAPFTGQVSIAVLSGG